MPIIPPHPQSVPSASASRTPSGKSRVTSATSSHKAKTPATIKTYEMPLQPLVSFSWVSFITLCTFLFLWSHCFSFGHFLQSKKSFTALMFILFYCVNRNKELAKQNCCLRLFCAMFKSFCVWSAINIHYSSGYVHVIYFNHLNVYKLISKPQWDWFLQIILVYCFITHPISSEIETSIIRPCSSGKKSHFPPHLPKMFVVNLTLWYWDSVRIWQTCLLFKHC